MDVARLWSEHQQAPFPATALGIAVDGLPLVKLDATAGAALTASLRGDGVVRPLPESRRADLARMRDLAEKATAGLPLDETTRAYFTRLARLADIVLKA